jgi:cytochrome c556
MIRGSTSPVCNQGAAIGFLGLVALGFGLGAVALASVALSQDGDNGRDNDRNIARPVDVIIARKALMDAIDTHMDELESIVAAAKVELAEGKDHADTISVLLLSFRHLFPPGTDLWKPDAARDPGRDTFAAPEVWTAYADFYQRADAASKIAYDASRSDDEDGLKKYTAELRKACDSCHAIYLRKN